MLDYKIHAENKSLYNTPPCFGIYMCGLVFEDLIAQGGLSEVEKKNVKKAQILYDTIDGSKGFFRCPVEKSVRSLMNVPFTLAKPELEAEFIKEAAKEKMVQLKGHRSGWRHESFNIQCYAFGRGRDIGRIYEGFPGKAWCLGIELN
ncbi:Phosphoserine aminotransferase 2 [Abeliophyllum distichum]|uniref:phosphoserine transaminase n=1 Tax=Abeliophyllum distichum TaxID=126358 RepID=A0ABD1S9Z2_9LAMI